MDKIKTKFLFYKLTKLHKVINEEKIINNCSSFDEDRYVKEYMAKYGIDK
jgi:hypothetical protein